MSRDEILVKLKEVLELVLGADNDKVNQCSAESKLAEDIGLDSVGILYIVIGIEEIFGVRFENVGFGDFKTVGDVIDYLEERV